MATKRERMLAQMAERRERLLQTTLLPGERVLAEGRAAYMRLGEVPSGGSTYTYLWVTDHRLLWSDVWGKRVPWTLSLDTVTSYEESVFETHRYVLTLQHRAVTRIDWAPRWQFLWWWRWGNAMVPQVRTEASFWFSRRSTEAARVLRRELQRRGVPRLPDIA